MVKSRIDQGHADIGCPRCDARWRISEGARQARASNPSVERELVALKTQIEERKREDIQDIRAAFKPIKLFLSYAHSDESLRQELMKHLSLLQRQGVIQTWHDRNINAGDDWKQQIDDNLNTATVILLADQRGFPRLRLLLRDRDAAGFGAAQRWRGACDSRHLTSG